MFSVARELSEEEHDIVDRETAGFYRVFVELVAEGRGRTAEEIQEIARGRVWSGADARARGLVDRLGGLAEAVDEVRSRTGLPPAVARRLLPRRARARRLDVPAPEPPAAAALGPEFSALWALLSSDERVLLWAPVPRIA
jgi:protease-4